MTEDVYMNLPAFPLTNKDVCYNILTAIGKRDKPPKIVAGRLKTIEAIVSNFQLKSVIKVSNRQAMTSRKNCFIVLK